MSTKPSTTEQTRLEIGHFLLERRKDGRLAEGVIAEAQRRFWNKGAPYQTFSSVRCSEELKKSQLMWLRGEKVAMAESPNTTRTR